MAEYDTEDRRELLRTLDNTQTEQCNEKEQSEQKCK